MLRPLQFGALACVVLAAGIGCAPAGDGAGPRLIVTRGLNDISISVPAASHKSWSFGDMHVCLDQEGSVRVISVLPLQESGAINVTQFRFRPNVWWTGDGPNVGALQGDLDTVGFEGRSTITIACQNREIVNSEMAVTLVRPGSETARLNGLVITYLSKGKRETLHYPITYSLRTPPNKPG